MAVKGRGRGRVGGAHGGGAHAGAGGGGGRARGRGRGKGGNSVSQFLAPHTGRQASKIANKEAGAEYNPEIRTDREEIKGSRKREADLGSWYAQLAADYGQSQAAGAAALQSVENTSSQQLAEAGARSSSDQASLAASDEAFANLTGGPKDTEGLAKIAQAGQAASAARVDQAKLPISEQADFTARLGSDKTASRLKGIEARTEEQNRRDKLKTDLVAARKEKGGARVANKEKIRESDRGYSSELKKLALAKKEARTAAQAAAASAALAQLKASHEATEDSIANRQAQERIGVSRRNAGTAAASAAATAKHYKHENSGGLTAAEKRARGEHKADAMSAAKALLGIKVPKSSKQWAQFEAALIEKLGSSYSAEASKAVAKLRAAQAAKSRGAYSKRIAQGKADGPPAPRGR
jgi:hypothetical protein